MPTGTVTFAFTDIEGSTQRWDRDRSAMQVAVRRHDELMRAAVEANGGYVFKTIGDAFCVAFARSEAAIAAMVRAQRELAADDFSAVDGIRVRIALHTGTADERDGDYFGPTVNRVARLLSIGHGGQILISAATAELLRDDRLELRDLGLHRLKDIAEPEHVRQLIVAGLSNDFPALRSLNAHSNLPLQLTGLIGRRDALDEIKALSVNERLVTLLGAGGVGKTRLALHVAAESLDGSGDGVWLVELAGLRDASLVALEIASAIGLPSSANVPALENLVRGLAGRRMLLVLDNCEHLIAEVARIVTGVMRFCPEVRIIATSREPLGIAGEYVFRLPPLAIPTRSTGITASEAARSAAVSLFVERARAASRSFVLTDDNAADVCDIVRRVDGIALAIELAATRISMLSVHALAVRLEERLKVLTGGARTAMPHQRTMRALIDWSYELLSETERAVLRRLSVFAGGLTLESAERVCAGESVSESDVFDLLAQLLDKSLVTAEITEAATRYRLLETTREYAREKLERAGESDATLSRHAGSVADFAYRLHGAYDSSPAWFAEIETEIDNARAALDWAVTLGNDPVAGARIVTFGFSGWWFYKSPNEGLRWSRAAFAALDAERDPLEKAGVARVAGCFANGDEAIGFFREALEIRDRHPEFATIERSFLLSGIASIQFSLGRHDEASDAIDRALQIRETEGPNVRVASMMLDTRAKIFMARGLFDEAAAVLARAEAGYASVGEMPGLAEILMRRANICFARRDPQAALELLERASEIFQLRSVSNQGAESLGDAAACRMALGDDVGCERDARESIAIRGDARESVSGGALLALATLAERDANPEGAAALLGYVEAHLLEEITPDRLIANHVRATLHARLAERFDAATLAALSARGAALHERGAIAAAERSETKRIA